MIETTIGGKRLGAGKQQKAYLHNYERSTFNLGRDWRSTMAAGVLTPFFTEIGLPGDQFDIDLNALVKTLPTQTPLFGTFKLQIDMFRVPIRLYQKLLHNNQKGVGLQMDKIYLPLIELQGNLNNEFIAKFNDSCLMAYLGMRGIGSTNDPATIAQGFLRREVNATPLLAYYDIFANYYCNKQEKNAYVITKRTENLNIPPSTITNVTSNTIGNQEETQQWSNQGNNTWYNEYIHNAEVKISGQNFNRSNIMISGYIADGSQTEETYYEEDLNFWESKGWIFNIEIQNQQITFDVNDISNMYIRTIQPTVSENLELVPFPLENLDKMRMDILEARKDLPFYIENNTAYLPYKANIALINNGATKYSANDYPMNGLLVKTYQSDIFNNWLSKDWIEGTNGIAEITSIDVSDGLKIDDLNLAKKVYNMLNRIAVSGGSMYDYIEAVYGVNTIGGTEIPIYEGGMSSEIVFSEVINQTAGDTEAGGEPLGALGGKGGLNGKKGGHVKIYCNEWSIIMGIVSITPRIDYSQGNMWYLTELKTFDDFHKPALDEIGFQNLMSEQMDFRTANYKDDLGGYNFESQVIGKIPAWMNYMTSFNQVYGEFADNNQAGSMVLKRDYEVEKVTSTIDEVTKTTTQLADATTYIDPEKYNYPFAYKRLDAQNYWVQIAVNCKARRKMSAKVIPNL